MTVRRPMKKFRYSIIPAAAITDSAIKPRSLQVLCLLGRHSDDYGWCRRSQVQMAKELTCGRATIQRAIEELDEAGYIECRAEGRGSASPDPTKQPFAAASYRVLLDLDGDSDAEHERTHKRARAKEVPTDEHVGVPIDEQEVPALSGHEVPISRAPLVEHSPSEHSLSQQRARESVAADALKKGGGDPLENFPAIWAACQQWPNFPPDASEARMQAAYLRCKPDLPPDAELIACIAEQGYVWNETNRQRQPRLGKLLIPHPNTWLEKHQGWRLHIETVRAEPARKAAADAKYAAALSGIPASILAKMAAQGIGPADVESWFGGAQFAFGPPPRFVVASEFRRDWIRNNLRKKLERALGGDVVVDAMEARGAA